MSDDPERRIRDALHAAPLPPAPETLRNALESLPTSDIPAPRKRRIGPALLAVAAGMTLVVGIAGFVALTHDRGTGIATPGPTGSAATPGSVHVLDTSELAAAISAQRAGGLAPEFVVTAVGIDGTRASIPITRECHPLGTCTVIGTLDGFADPEGTVTIRASDSIVLPPTTASDLAGPVALRLSGTAPIEYLGHVAIAGAGGSLAVPALLAATASTPGGLVVAVDGWLEGPGRGIRCGGAPLPGPLPAPFNCGPMRSLIEPVPVKPLSPLGSGRFDPPEGSVFVQTGAYDLFAPDPADDGVNFEPRHGLYLVRMVVYEATNCVGCRGWLVVGRLDATPAPVATSSIVPGTDMTVRSAAELAALLTADRGSLLDQPVFVDGRIVPGLAPTCTPTAATCDLGTLEGTDERVTASGYTSTLLLPDADFPTNGVMALVVRTNGLEYLGWMDRGGLVASFANLLDSGQPRGPLTYIVSGWLVAAGPWPCPAPAVYVPPPDTPFQTCPWAWLTRDRVQPVTVNPDGGSSMAPPPNAIRVQPTAYSEFAPDPQPEPGGGANQPRFGTYLVRLVTNTSSTDALPERGWQVVARLSP